jgi:uncharacterized protein (DUF3820 family)
MKKINLPPPYTLTFGRYKGTDVIDITDLQYLKWLEEQYFISDSLRKVINFRIKQLEDNETSLGFVRKR